MSTISTNPFTVPKSTTQIRNRRHVQQNRRTIAVETSEKQRTLPKIEIEKISVHSSKAKPTVSAVAVYPNYDYSEKERTKLTKSVRKLNEHHWPQKNKWQFSPKVTHAKGLSESHLEFYNNSLSSFKNWLWMSSCFAPKQSDYISPKLYIAEINYGYFGVVAGESIPSGKVIGQFTGELEVFCAKEKDDKVTLEITSSYLSKYDESGFFEMLDANEFDVYRTHRDCDKSIYYVTLEKDGL